MKLFQKTSVAVALTIIMIAAAIGIGQWRARQRRPVEETAQSTGLDSSLSTAAYTKWIDDQANVLTDQQEEQICLFNANWVKRYDSLIAVATRTSIDGNIDDYAYDLGVQIELAAARRHPGYQHQQRRVLPGGRFRLPHDRQPGILLHGSVPL